MKYPHDPAREGLPTLDIDGAVARITLRRPSLRNSLNDDDLRTLLNHFAAVDADQGVRVLVLGADTGGQPRPVFSAGYHVGGLDRPGSGPQVFEQIPDALESLRPITVCALNGSVYGGATDLVLACDLRVALAGTEWRMPAAALGLHYYPGGLRRYVSRFGIDLAKRAFLTAQPLPVEHLAAQGVFDLVHVRCSPASTFERPNRLELVERHNEAATPGVGDASRKCEHLLGEQRDVTGGARRWK